jgi:hypothetical protein
MCANAQYGLVYAGANFQQNQCTAAAVRGTRLAAGLIRVEGTAIIRVNCGLQIAHIFKQIVSCEEIAGIGWFEGALQALSALGCSGFDLREDTAI